LGMGSRILWSARFAGFGAVLCGGLPSGGACWRRGRSVAVRGPGGAVGLPCGHDGGGCRCCGGRWCRIRVRPVVGGGAGVCLGCVLGVMRRGVSGWSRHVPAPPFVLETG
jgi:hypothetical protein